jgi:glycosyltransferase involved in cell wall biosynthesis
MKTINDENIKVSVAVITYNQEKTIGRAIDSILEQKTDFRYEILIADDASSDGTPEILKEYSVRYPDLIKIRLRNKNGGATKNSYDLFMEASGEYIAFLEGDDYWTDRNKLAMQAEFLDLHDEYIGTAGKCNAVNEEGMPLQDIPGNDRFWEFDNKIFSLADLCKWKMPSQIGAVMYRNIYKTILDDYSILYRLHPMVGDRTTVMLLTVNGNIYCDKNYVMNYLYRTQGTGNWMSVKMRTNDRFDDYKLICDTEKYLREHYHKNIHMYHIRNERIAGAAISYMMKPDSSKKEELKNMLRYGGRIIPESCTAVSAVIQKKLHILAGHSDKRVWV